MTLRLGIIGTGAIGRDHIRRCTATLPGATVVAASDVDADIARRALAPFNPDGRAYGDGHALIASADVDAVLVTSWGSTHAQYVLAAIAAGKPVFCEKPLATTADDCRRIVDAETAAGRRLVQVGFMRPYDQGYRELRRLVASGALGEVLMVHAAHRNAASPERFSTEMMINDTLVHELDVLRFLLDDDYVSAQVVFPRRSAAAPATLRDPQIALLETRRGIRIDVEIFVNCGYGYDIRCELVGERGTASLPDPPAIPIRRAARLETAILTDWKDRFVDAYDRELRDFIAQAADGTVIGPSAWDGYAACVAVDACVAAQASGGVVPIVIPDTPAFYRS